MSWSVSAIGRPAAVAASVERQFSTQGVCAEPEESIRQSARALIAAGLAAQKPESAVRIEASGSMSRDRNAETGNWDGPCTSNLKVEIQPLYGFVE